MHSLLTMIFALCFRPAENSDVSPSVRPASPVSPTLLSTPKPEESLAPPPTAAVSCTEDDAFSLVQTNR